MSFGVVPVLKVFTMSPLSGSICVIVRSSASRTQTASSPTATLLGVLPACVNDARAPPLNRSTPPRPLHARRAAVPAGEADDGEGDGGDHDCAPTATSVHAGGAPGRPAGAAGGRSGAGGRLLAQNRLLELLERRARIDAELLDERAARVPVDVERLRLPPRAVEREHELGAEALAERVGGDELLQLADDVRMPAEGEIRLDPALERGQAQLLEARDRRLRERLVGEVGERRPAPEARASRSVSAAAAACPEPSARSPASTRAPRTCPGRASRSTRSM